MNTDRSFKIKENVKTSVLIQEAQLLKSEDGENKEYDRALVELIGYVLGYDSDNQKEIADYIGIDYSKLYQ